MAIKPSTSAPKGRTLVELAQARAGGRPIDGGSPGPKGGAFAQRMAAREREAAVWDPETEDMPSPFLPRVRRGDGLVSKQRF